MFRIRSTSRMLLALALGFPLLVAGCGGNVAARPADEDTARRALHEALEAWKGGEPHDALSKRPAPIRVADEDWLAGARLLSYRVEPGDEKIGTNLTCDVVLSLQRPNGRKAKKHASYLIGTDPVPMVIRQD
jgi:hypothetical protein